MERNRGYGIKTARVGPNESVPANDEGATIWPMKFDAYIFDLDGTLLDTLADLVRLTNMVLDQRGWPQRTTEEILSFVGDGGWVLLRRAAPAGVSDDVMAEAFEQWEALYPTYGHALTKPYEGIPEALAELKARDAKLGVLSNKEDGAVQEVIARHFPGMFDAVQGECDEVPRKPDPRGLRRLMAQLGVQPQQVAYLGDTGTDMQAAVAAGVFPIGVAWGYRSVAELQKAGAQHIITAPNELLSV